MPINNFMILNEGDSRPSKYNTNMTIAENEMKKSLSIRLRAKGLGPFADLLDAVDFHLTSNPKDVAYMNPADGAVTLNINIPQAAQITIVKHELMHEYLYHQIQMMDNLKKRGIDIQELQKLSLAKWVHLQSNYAGDYDISNQVYTDEDKEIVKTLIINGKKMAGLVTELDSPGKESWKNLTFEEMFEELTKDLKDKMEKLLQQPQPEPQGGEPGTPGSQGGEPGDEPGEEPGDEPGWGPVVPVKPGTSGPQGSSPKGTPSKLNLGDDFWGDDDYDDEPDDKSDNQEDSSNSNGKSSDEENSEDKPDETQGKPTDEVGDDDDPVDLNNIFGPKSSKAERDAEQAAREEQIAKELIDKIEKDIENDNIDEDDPLTKKIIDDINNLKKLTDDQKEELAEIMKRINDAIHQNNQEKKGEARKTIDKIFDNTDLRKELIDSVANQIEREKQEIVKKSAKEAELRQYAKDGINLANSNQIKNDLVKLFNVNTSMINRKKYNGKTIMGVPVKSKYEVPQINVPTINVYFDVSGSWSKGDVELGESYLSELIALGESVVKLKIYYFNTAVEGSYTDAMKHSCGTELGPVVEHITATKPQNVIIMTDSDTEYECSSGMAGEVTIPGIVMLWFRSRRAPSIENVVRNKSGKPALIYDI